MSSPNHSTSNIEDAFSSMNILNYTSVSPDYFPALVGSSSFNSSENSNVNMIQPVFSSFYNNTYLKDVQAIYAKELPISSPDPITPPAILTLSPILPPSLLFDPWYFFIPEELLPPKKRIHSSSSSSTTLSNSSRNQTCNLVSPSSSVYTPTPPQVFEIGKCSDKIMPPKRTSTSETPAITLDAIRQLIADFTAALEAQTTAMASASNPNRNTRPREILNAYAQPMGIEQANQITWTELKKLLTNKYCPRTEIKKMEDEFYGLTVNGSDLKTYIRRFQELAILGPNMVPNTEKLMEAFIGGLPQSIEGNITASKPQTLEEATNIAHRLMDQIIKRNSVQETNNHKRKFDDRRNTTNNNNYSNNHDKDNYPNDRNNNNHSNNHINKNNYPDNHNNNNRNNDYHHQQNRRQEPVRTYPPKKYHGNLPLCTRCTLHHTRVCTVKCQTCNKVGHLTE
ncbi:reverse transcriptase domain-containing protein [Tanacetum coccineum]